MSAKLQLNRPVLIMLYGFPGSGKTFFARQLSDVLSVAHVSSERIRFELFENPQYDKNENDLVQHLMNYMTEEFLRAGISVIYDMNAANLKIRRSLRDMARAVHAESILLWLQIDLESAFARGNKRDRRKADDRFNPGVDREQFDRLIQPMQNPKDEDYIVISGKHTFNAQRDTLLKRLQMLGFLSQAGAAPQAVKPGLVNLIPRANVGRVDMSRRNISIRGM